MKTFLILSALFALALAEDGVCYKQVAKACESNNKQQAQREYKAQFLSFCVVRTNERRVLVTNERRDVLLSSL